MNLQSIILFCYFFGFTSGIGEPGFLTLENNRERLMNCGIQGAINISDQNPWLWVASFKKDEGEPTLTAASMISPRHFLTSAHVILNQREKWRNGEGVFGKSYCIHGSTNAKVPKHILSGLEITKNECIQSGTWPPKILSTLCESEFKVEPVRAYILRMCDERISTMFIHEAAPMIVEVDRPILPNYAPHSYRCVSNSTTGVTVGEKVYLLKFGDEKEPIKELQILYNLPNMIATNNYVFPSNDGIGNPLLKLINWKWTIVGIATHNLYQSVNNKFHDLKWFHKDICNLTGICEIRRQDLVNIPAVTTEKVTQKPENPTSSSSLSMAPIVFPPIFKSTQPAPSDFGTSDMSLFPTSTTMSNDTQMEIEETEPHDYLHDETVFREIKSWDELRSEYFDYDDEKDRENDSGIRELFIVFLVVLGCF